MGGVWSFWRSVAALLCSGFVRFWLFRFCGCCVIVFFVVLRVGCEFVWLSRYTLLAVS